ncbi:MAG TPA: hypothetical protein VF049_09135 [Nocardioidaceae bacterium]
MSSSADTAGAMARPGAGSAAPPPVAVSAAAPSLGNRNATRTTASRLVIVSLVATQAGRNPWPVTFARATPVASATSASGSSSHPATRLIAG